MKCNNIGFTLVEMSIILVIIGLIVGAIFTGSTLSRSAALKSVITDFNTYKTAIHAFDEKYTSYPGDLVNARAYWPNDSVYAGFVTQNGNGDRRIEWASESHQSWQHLNAAELIPGKFTGIFGSGSRTGINIPDSTIKGGGFDLYHSWWYGTAAGGDRNRILFGSERPLILTRALYLAHPKHMQ